MHPRGQSRGNQNIGACRVSTAQTSGGSRGFLEAAVRSAREAESSAAADLALDESEQERAAARLAQVLRSQVAGQAALDVAARATAVRLAEDARSAASLDAAFRTDPQPAMRDEATEAKVPAASAS
jgi:hypothetical protein